MPRIESGSLTVFTARFGSCLLKARSSRCVSFWRLTLRVSERSSRPVPWFSAQPSAACFALQTCTSGCKPDGSACTQLLEVNTHSLTCASGCLFSQPLSGSWRPRFWPYQLLPKKTWSFKPQQSPPELFVTYSVPRANETNFIL